MSGVKLPPGKYWEILCRHCHHPGGAHIIDQWEPRVTHCQCGECPGWEDGFRGFWSREQSEGLRRPA